MSFYRIQSPARDTADLLVPEHQTSMHYSTGETMTGVSVCDSREELATYLAHSGVEFDGSWVLVEVDGYTAEDRDLDADEPGSPRLIHPTEVLSVEPIAAGFEDEIFAAYDLRYAGLTEEHEMTETYWAMTWCGVELTSDTEAAEHVG